MTNRRWILRVVPGSWKSKNRSSTASSRNRSSTASQHEREEQHHAVEWASLRDRNDGELPLRVATPTLSSFQPTLSHIPCSVVVAATAKRLSVQQLFMWLPFYSVQQASNTCTRALKNVKWKMMRVWIWRYNRRKTCFYGRNNQTKAPPVRLVSSFCTTLWNLITDTS